ncbi:MAG: carbon monoxide dehydrogenase beta subunit family protein [Ignisphaera sp.]
MALEYWLKGDIPPGPIRATVLTDIGKVVDIIKRSRHSAVMFIGSNIRTIEKILNADIIKIITEISKITGIPIITSDALVVRRLDEAGFTNYKIAFPLELVQKLSRREFNYQLVVLIGTRYTYGWLLLNHLKHYRADIQTLSIDPYAQPNATWTLPSLPLQLWFKNLLQMIEILKSSTT